MVDDQILRRVVRALASYGQARFAGRRPELHDINEQSRRRAVRAPNFGHRRQRGDHEARVKRWGVLRVIVCGREATARARGPGGQDFSTVPVYVRLRGALAREPPLLPVRVLTRLTAASSEEHYRQEDNEHSNDYTDDYAG